MNIAILNNGTGEPSMLYRTERLSAHRFEFIPALQLGRTDLSPFDMFIAPNGTDHVALYKSREKIRAFLDEGKIVMCFCGWTTDWIPGARWVMQTDIPLRTYSIRFPNPAHPVLEGVGIEEVNLSNGKRGFWSCGHIEVTPNAEVLMMNNLNQCVMFVDEKTTRGAIVATASAPVPGFGEKGKEGNLHAFDQLFENLLRWSEHKLSLLQRSH